MTMIREGINTILAEDITGGTGEMVTLDGYTGVGGHLTNKKWHLNEVFKNFTVVSI